VDIERENMSASMLKRRSLISYKELKINWEKELYLVETAAYGWKDRCAIWPRLLA
jgi:hypothetical protein